VWMTIRRRLALCACIRQLHRQNKILPSDCGHRAVSASRRRRCVQPVCSSVCTVTATPEPDARAFDRPENRWAIWKVTIRSYDQPAPYRPCRLRELGPFGLINASLAGYGLRSTRIFLTKNSPAVTHPLTLPSETVLAT